MRVVEVLKCVVVEKFEKRSDSTIAGMVMDASGQQKAKQASTSVASSPHPNFFMLYVNCDIKNGAIGEAALSLVPRQRAIFTKVKVYEASCSVTVDTKVLKNVSKFLYDEEALEGFLKPEVVSVAEARGSPKKRRLSVKGDITEVGECYSTNDYTRRTVWIEEEGAKIEVVLWGQSALKKLCPSKGVLFECLRKEERRLSSTSSTTITMSDVMDGKGTIIGISDVDCGYPVEMVLECGDILYVGEEIEVDLEKISLPQDINYRATSKGIVEMMEIVME